MDSIECPGTIKKITLTNFMEYKHIEFCPGPNLNILLGPTGAGKSSVMYGIILGLGGKPKDTGKPAEIKHYINKDLGNKAKIIIEMKNNNGPNYVVQREFDQNNKTTWQLNGKRSSLKQVITLTKSLNIRLGNICQMVPQGRIQDFSKLKPKQILKNTIEAVGLGFNDLLQRKATLDRELKALTPLNFFDVEFERRKLRTFRVSYIMDLNRIRELKIRGVFVGNHAAEAAMQEDLDELLILYEQQIQIVNEVEERILILKSVKAKIEQLKVEWIDCVTNLIDQINDRFAMLFSRMLFVGEVSLYEPLNEGKFEDYGIIINVQFSNSDQLGKLRFNHSSTEKVMTTVLYMLALQDLTTVPFRCVDEIIEGLDVMNERMVYKLLMESVKSSTATQYFMATHKLLYNMTYTEETDVFCVLDGDIVPIDRFNAAETMMLKMKSGKRKFSDI